MATSSNQPVNPDDSLPPVEPPSAAFLVQLFLVPGIIVAIIVCLLKGIDSTGSIGVNVNNLLHL